MNLNKNEMFIILFQDIRTFWVFTLIKRITVENTQRKIVESNKSNS